MGFALAAVIMAIVASFFGSSPDVSEHGPATETAVTEQVSLSEVTTVIREVISDLY